MFGKARERYLASHSSRCSQAILRENPGSRVVAAARTVSEPLEAHDLTVCFYLSSRTAFMFAATARISFNPLLYVVSLGFKVP